MLAAHGIPVKAGTTDVSVILRVIDSGDGTPETGVDHATSGIDLKYWREGGTATDITEASLAALSTAHTDGGVEQIGAGYIRVDLPDAACASGATAVHVFGSITGMVVMGATIPLIAYDPMDTVRLGLTALPNAAAAASGGLFTRGTGAGQINQDANGRIDVNAVAAAGTAWNSGAIGASTLAADTLTAAKFASDVTTELQSGLATAAALAVVDGIVDNLVSGIIFGAAATGTLSTTVATSNLSGYANDQLIGRVLIWLTGNCEGEATTITDYASASGTLTFTALTTAPGNGDTFKIV